jgi:hypothetical protein
MPKIKNAFLSFLWQQESSGHPDPDFARLISERFSAPAL